jgi:hypothetical protein
LENFLTAKIISEIGLSGNDGPMVAALLAALERCILAGKILQAEFFARSLARFFRVRAEAGQWCI